ncbi:hypothetical protein BLN97_19070 [Bradyrhizobium elkanii]|nr:hypothetical protein BLN97_19070 [Bradyrhizobium elkanii]
MRHQLSLGGGRRRDRDGLGVLEVGPHEVLDIAAERDAGVDARLVDIRPGCDRAALAHDGIDAARQIRIREGDGLRAFHRRPDAEHAEIAFVGLQVGDETAKAGLHIVQLHAHVLGELPGEIDVDPLELSAIWVAERNRIVHGPDADPEHPALGDLVESRLRLLGSRRRHREKERANEGKSAQIWHELQSPVVQ